MKGWLLFGDKDCENMWKTSVAAVNKYVADEAALDAFFAGARALSGDLDRAKRLQESSYKMWATFGIEPEEINYMTMKIDYDGYDLRPENIESAYYLYHLTKDPHYIEMGHTYYESLVKYCRTDDAYAALRKVQTREKADRMESFLLAETFKYLYLLFAPPDTVDLGNHVFNTEAHPLYRTW